MLFVCRLLLVLPLNMLEGDTWSLMCKLRQPRYSHVQLSALLRHDTNKFSYKHSPMSGINLETSELLAE